MRGSAAGFTRHGASRQIPLQACLPGIMRGPGRGSW